MSLQALRAELDQIDADLLALIAKRQRLVEQIGKLKHSAGRPLRDFRREREVIERAQSVAETLGLPATLAESVLRTLIYHSLSHQEQRKVLHARHGAGKQALVIGGLGRMGEWFARFLDSQGYSVEVADPADRASLFPRLPDWRETISKQDLIVVAAPLQQTNALLTELAGLRPTGLVFDIGSLKQPLRTGLRALREAGCQVTSVHPLFGPDVTMLSGRHVVFVDVGVGTATTAAKALFGQTMADCAELSLDEHDHAMAYILGLSHLLNIAFAATLAAGQHTPAVLKQLSSTTFAQQLKIAGNVIAENPYLYYEIQQGNTFSAQVYMQLQEQIDKLIGYVTNGDQDNFVQQMQQAKQHLSDHHG